ncbi:SRPBCC domain-containing protein [Labrenzia sp. 011]|uniref:SRPBCC family protein n=1 Tax=Labrenzia sp. 011 TaxID=2171494 RepID=UPI000D506BEF|nr:SRPBCC domain-containing protein [Labrenzia sp. 011]PVB61661.1 hypothetical protein DCO57_10800 [Labrenzia sp. 011]
MTIQQQPGSFLKSEPGAEPVLIDGLFRASPQRVFRAFTEPDEIRSWFVPGDGGLVAVEIDLQVGGRWCFVIERSEEKQVQLEGEYLTIDAPNRLEFSWRHVQEFTDGRREATDSSRVVITFTQAGKATEVKLRHEAIRTEDGRRGVGGGWDGCLARLAELLAT